MTVSVEPGALVPGPGGFATSLQGVLHQDDAQEFIDFAPIQPPQAEPRQFAAADPVPVFPVPRLSAGLRLHGEYQGSGFTEPKYIARRGDGQVVQLSRLLHLVAGAVDGVRDTERIAHRVSGLYGREVSEENIAYLVEQKLQPLGVTVPFGQEDDEVADAPRSDLLLALKGHKVMFNAKRVNTIGRSLAWLHRPLMVVLVLAAMVFMDVWLFGFYGAITPVLEVLNQPVLLLVVFGLTVASVVFHEFGHASACRYGGARPGCIGCGFFLIWPSMYTDVTDVYRIGRGGRIRTDLGGVYFNIVFMLGMGGAYFLTGQQFFLSAVYLGHFEVLEQLMPAVRLDGYYILGDLAGVPDLFGKIKPILLSMLPGKPVRPEVAGLKRSARIIVTTWVLTMVPLLLGDLGYAMWNLPRILTTGARSLVAQLSGTASAFAGGHFAVGLVGVLGSFMLVCPLAGMAYLSIRLGGRLLRTALRATSDSPKLRLAFCAVALSTVAGLGVAWAGGATPKPLPQQPPLVPVLQPGVPTTEPAAPGQGPGPSTPGGSGGSASPGGGMSSGAGIIPGATPSASATASGTASSAASTPAAGLTTAPATRTTAPGKPAGTPATTASTTHAPSTSSATTAAPTTAAPTTTSPSTTAPATPTPTPTASSAASPATAPQ
jgi:putative peptide zinc metalloprotease protein